MLDQISQTLEIVRTHADASSGWLALVELCREVHPALPWEELSSPDVQCDLHETWLWLQNELSEDGQETGIYLGLGTLNMRGGKGTNIEFGATEECDPHSDSPAWAWDASLRYGSRHLIKGLVEPQARFSRPAWQTARDLGDYVFFLGYSGLILSEVFASFTLPRTSLPVWGFQSGDLFTLGRYHQGTYTKLCLA